MTGREGGALTVVPSTDTVITVGGWSAAYATVLAVASNGEVAFALVDTNGDGVEIDIDELIRDEQGAWHSGMSSGAGGSVTRSGRDAVCVLGYGQDWGGFRYAYGRADRPGPCQVRLDAEQIDVTVAETGWWVWVRPVDAPAEQPTVAIRPTVG